jgi:hypothetical protein
VESCRQTLGDAEQVKLDRYHSNCAAEGYSFEPLAFHCWSGLGPISSSLVNRLIKQIVGDSQGWRKQAVSDAIRHAVSSSLMKFVAKQLSIVSSVQPHWSLPEGLMDVVLAAAPPAANPPDPDAMDGLEGAPEAAHAPARPPADPFSLVLGPVPARLHIHRPPVVTDINGLPTPVAATADVAEPEPTESEQRLLPASFLEMAPEFWAAPSRVGLVISVRPASEAVASRTRSHR